MHSDLLLALLRLELFGAEVPRELLDGADWKAVFEEAKRQTVVGLVGEAIGRLPAEMQPAADVKNAFLRYTFRNLQVYSGLDNLLSEITDFYRGHGINGLVLKGQGVARYYGKPEARECGDIDFYIPQGHFDEALSLAVDRWQGGRRDISQETYKHYEFMVGPLTVELHRIPAICKRPWQKKRFNRWMLAHVDNPENARHIDIAGVDVLAPNVQFDAVYIFYHALSHLLEGEGVGLRQLCDWTMVLHRLHAQGGADAVAATVRSFGLERPWQIMGHIAVTRLGLPADEMPLYTARRSKLSDRLFAQIIDGGNFGKYSGDLTSVGKNKFWSHKFYLFRRFSKNLTKMWYLSPKDMAGTYVWYTVTGLKRAIATWSKS